MRGRSARALESLLSCLVLVVPTLPAVAAAGGQGSVVRSPGDPAYEVRLSTGAHGHVWTGTERISFTNLEAVPRSRIWLRLWSNGVLGCAGHSIKISRVRGGDPGAMRLDCTEVPIDLDAALPPGERTTISMRLRIRVPARNDRFGYHGGLVLVGTALPTLEVHDDRGWHHDPFIDLGESFYSVTGRYRVTLETPRGLDTPTTGVRVDRRRTADGRVVTTYAAGAVRDFAWAAGRLQRLTARSGRTRVVASYQPEAVSASRAEAALRDARKALGTFSESFGTYPYKEVDVVVAGFATFGGMEYPTIIFTNPKRLTISHELAHQWWYALVGNDEYAEPWLDESFATWSQFLPFRPRRGCTSYGWPGPGARITNGMDYWADNPGEYGTVYSGGACMLANLAHRFGLKRFTHVLRNYADRRWFGVATTADFKARVEKAAIKDQLPGWDAAQFWAKWRVD